MTMPPGSNSTMNAHCHLLAFQVIRLLSPPEPHFLQLTAPQSEVYGAWGLPVPTVSTALFCPQLLGFARPLKQGTEEPTTGRTALKLVHWVTRTERDCHAR